MGIDDRWLTSALRPFQYDVGSFVPPVFEAYARIFHPAYQLDTPEPNQAVSWQAVATANNRIAHPAMEWGSLVGSWRLRSQPGLWVRPPDTGRLPAPSTRALGRILRAYSLADQVVYALWNGYGELPVENAVLIALPHRDMLARTGSIDDATSPFGVPGRSANLWWAGDQKWCVATDIDLMTTYVGASAQCIREIVSSDSLEAFEVTSDQRVTWDADTVNPRPEPPGGYPSSL